MENIDKNTEILYSDFMGIKKILTILVLALFTSFTAISCVSGPETVQETADVVTDTPQTEVFDPRRVSQAHYNATREEVQHFIENLNQIIRNRNFNAWRSSLSEEYFAEISSQENLREISNQPAMRTRRIVLRTAEDYFQHVVVPSRADLRVDDIEFVSVNRVKAFTITTNRAGEEVRLRLYDLEKIGNTWTIIN